MRPRREARLALPRLEGGGVPREGAEGGHVDDVAAAPTALKVPSTVQ